MSFRNATKLTARFAASRSTIQPAARRYASTGAKKGSDAPWMIGSAVGFGSLGAFLLYPSKAQVHEFTHSTEHAKVRAEINESAPTVKQGEAIQATESGKYSPKSGNPTDNHKEMGKAPNEMPVKKDESKTMPDNLLEEPSLKPENKSGGKNANAVAQSQASDEDKENAPGSKSNDTTSTPESNDNQSQDDGDDKASGKENGEPTQKEIKDSILQAERANTPKAAMEEEVEESK